MQNIQQLALVFMQTLYLYVKYGIRVYINAVMFFDIFCQTDLVLSLNLHKFLLCLFIIHIRKQLL